MAETTPPAYLPTGFGGAVLVTRGGRPLVRAAAGVADAATARPLTPETVFQLCSVSKQFTAAAVLLLAEDGALDLHEPIVRHLPEAPPAWSAVTAHHLIGHTSGLGHWDTVPGFDACKALGAEAYLAELVEQPLLFEPGASWSYSSPGFLLAGMIVERITGAPYREFLARRIFGPLGMDSTSAAVPVRAAARGHVKGEPTDAPDFVALPGAGDVWSTVDDLARYAAAFDAGEILGADSRRLMTTAHAPVPEEAGAEDAAIQVGGYGYGYFLGTVHGRRSRLHTGDNPGFNTLQVRVPELDASIVVLSNQDETDTEAVGLHLLAHLPEVFR